MSKVMVIKILQLNVDRTKRVVSEVREMAIRNKIAVIAVQEPYVLDGKIAGFGVGIMKVYGGGEDATNVGAALVLLNPVIGIMKIEGLSDRNCVVAELVGKGEGKAVHRFDVLHTIGGLRVVFGKDKIY